MLIRDGLMTMYELEKAKKWPKTNHMDDIMTWYGIVYLAIIGHIQQDLSLLIVLEEHWDLNYNTFHLPQGEMIVTLANVYRIWEILIKGSLAH